MKVLQRVSRVLELEGVVGLSRKVLRSSMRGKEQRAARAVYDRQREEFRSWTQQLGRDDLDSFLWYHTVELDQGIVTPGDYDYRASWPAFGFPDDLRGQTVLDVGSATGFFAFELEKRGAQVTSVELASLATGTSSPATRKQSCSG